MIPNHIQQILEERSTGFLSRERKLSNRKDLPDGCWPSQYERFIAKIDVRDNFYECWNWLAGTIYAVGRTDANYAYFTLKDGRGQRSHRITYLEFCGDIPKGPKGKYEVRHLCHNKLCQNFTHLALGSAADNKRDTMLDNRQCKGMEHPKTKLTDKDVLEIWRLWNTGDWSQRCLGEKFGIAHQNIQTIISGKAWKHVTPPFNLKRYKESVL